MCMQGEIHKHAEMEKNTYKVRRGGGARHRTY